MEGRAYSIDLIIINFIITKSMAYSHLRACGFIVEMLILSCVMSLQHPPPAGAVDIGHAYCLAHLLFDHIHIHYHVCGCDIL